MAVKARFSPHNGSAVAFDNIEGYRIAAFFHPTNGFNGTFYIYIHELLSAEDEFASLDMSAPGAGLMTGTLSFTDESNLRDYQFKNIDLLTVQSFFTQEQKARILTFQYRAVITNMGNYCTIRNTDKSQDPQMSRSKMGQTYAFRVNGTPEPLLFFASRFSRNATPLVRLGALRNRSNSFLDLAMRMDAELQAAGLQPKTIIVKGLNIDFNRNNLQGLLVDESYGSFLSVGVSSLDTIAVTDQASYGNLTAIDFQAFSPDVYLQHSQNPRQVKYMNQGSSVETATIILVAGATLTHSSAIV